MHIGCRAKEQPTTTGERGIVLKSFPSPLAVTNLTLRLKSANPQCINMHTACDTYDSQKCYCLSMCGIKWGGLPQLSGSSFLLQHYKYLTLEIQAMTFDMLQSVNPTTLCTQWLQHVCLSSKVFNLLLISRHNVKGMGYLYTNLLLLYIDIGYLSL